MAYQRSGDAYDEATFLEDARLVGTRFMIFGQGDPTRPTNNSTDLGQEEGRVDVSAMDPESFGRGMFYDLLTVEATVTPFSAVQRGGGKVTWTPMGPIDNVAAQIHFPLVEGWYPKYRDLVFETEWECPGVTIRQILNVYELTWTDRRYGRGGVPIYWTSLAKRMNYNLNQFTDIVASRWVPTNMNESYSRS